MEIVAHTSASPHSGAGQLECVAANSHGSFLESRSPGLSPWALAASPGCSLSTHPRPGNCLRVERSSKLEERPGRVAATFGWARGVAGAPGTQVMDALCVSPHTARPEELSPALPPP